VEGNEVVVKLNRTYQLPVNAYDMNLFWYDVNVITKGMKIVINDGKTREIELNSENTRSYLTIGKQDNDVNSREVIGPSKMRQI
jgi:hypothetical protein